MGETPGLFRKMKHDHSTSCTLYVNMINYLQAPTLIILLRFLPLKFLFRQACDKIIISFYL